MLFLDDDILCPPDLLTQHLAAIQAFGPISAFGPVLTAPESPDSLAADMIDQFYKERDQRLSTNPEPMWPRFSAGNANTSVPLSFLHATGGFDEHFTGARDDWDLGMRLWKMGLRFRFLPTAVTHQIHVKPSEISVRRDAVAAGRNDILLCGKHPEYRPYSLPARFNLGPVWKAVLREVIVRSPVSMEPLVRIPYSVSHVLRRVPGVRYLGVKLLQLRIGINMWRAAMAQIGSRVRIPGEGERDSGANVKSIPG